MRSLWILLCPLLIRASSPTLTIPSWTDPSPTHSRSQLVTLAQDALDKFNQFFVSSHGFYGLPSYDTARLFWTMAMKDYVAGTADNQNVTAELAATDLSQYYGVAATYAYRAYHEQDMLDLAVSIWRNVSQYQITAAQAISGNHPFKNVSFSGTCNSASAAGAVFSNTVSNDLGFDQTTSGFMLLSTHLAEIASNNTYTSAAVAAGQFLSTVMLDAKTGLVIDSGTLGNGTVACNVNPPYTPFRPYATGQYIEALAVLADVDAAAAAQWTQLLLNAVEAATQNGVWFNTGAPPVGVLTFPFNSGSVSNTIDDETYNGRLVQSLYAPWTRTNSSDVQAYLGAFINVQVNAILQRATNNGTNVYGANWVGPPPSQFDMGGQVSATCALTAAIGPPPASNSSAPGTPSSGGFPSPTASAATTSDSRSSTLPLALGLGLGIPAAGILAAVLAWVLVRRRRAALYGDFAAKSDENMRAAGVPSGAGTSPGTALPITPYALASMPNAPQEQSYGASGRRPGEKASVSLSWAGQHPLGSTSTPFGSGHAATSSTSGISPPSTSAASATFPGEMRPMADAIETRELLRVLDARGMLAAAQEAPPVYEETSR